MTELTGRAITVDGQQKVVKDLIAARLAAGGEIRFDVDDVRLSGLDRDGPVITYTRRRPAARAPLRRRRRVRRLPRHLPDRGPGRRADDVRTHLPRSVGSASSTEELIYCHSPRGFALVSMRSPTISRLYLQVDPDTDLSDWPDRRVWDELHTRLEGIASWRLTEGPVIDKGITAMRSMVVEPMQWRRLYLAGDAVHIVPPTGAKGMNLALADVHALGNALATWYADGRTDLLESYSRTCLERVWRARLPGHDPYTERLQLAQLRYLTTSESYARSLSENDVGMPFA